MCKRDIMNLIRSFFKVFFLFPLYYVARYIAVCAATLGPSIVLPCNLDTATEWIIGVNCTIVKSTINTILFRLSLRRIRWSGEQDTGEKDSDLERPKCQRGSPVPCG